MDRSVYKLEQEKISMNSSEGVYDEPTQSISDIMKDLKIKIIEINKKESEIEFDVIGVGPAIANSIRRILLAELPSMAIDHIHMLCNTTVIPDEVLAHRIGLIPIKVDPRTFVPKSSDDEKALSDENVTIQFELKVKCTRRPNAPKNTPIADEVTCYHSSVYSGDLKFIPIGDQVDMYGDVRPVHEDILLAKMRPGHEIDLKAFCFKNIGREHAKFSPVVIATYRLHPEIRLLDEICDENADTLAKCFPEGVIKVSEKKGRKVAKVENSRGVLCSRNALLYDELKGAVEICKRKNHYIFNVESVGAQDPEALVSAAIQVLKDKCRYFLTELRTLKT